jgi:hypothetical protein
MINGWFFLTAILGLQATPVTTVMQNRINGMKGTFAMRNFNKKGTDTVSSSKTLQMKCSDRPFLDG